MPFQFQIKGVNERKFKDIFAGETYRSRVTRNGSESTYRKYLEVLSDKGG